MSERDDDRHAPRAPAADLGGTTPSTAAPGRGSTTSRMPASARGIAKALAAELRGPVQGSGELSEGEHVHAAAAAGIAGTGARLPHLDAIQRAFGHHDVGGVRAHVGGAAADASQAMGARAYATGNDVAFAASPDLHLAAHEAAHVVQQRGGVQLSGGVGSAGDPYERHADAVAELVTRGESAESLLDQHASPNGPPGRGVQRWAQLGSEYYRGRVQDESGVPAASAGGGDPDAGVPSAAPDAGARRPSDGGNEFPVQVYAGSGSAEGQRLGEAEWRAALGRGNDDVLRRLYGFLRAAMLDDAAWLEHARAHQADIPEGTGWRQAGIHITDGRRSLRRPTDDEQLGLAKAIYLRRDEMGLELGHAGMSELMSAFMARWQPRLLENMADGDGVVAGPEGAAPVARASSHDHHVTILGSAYGTIIEGAMRYSLGRHVSGEGRDWAIQTGTREVRNACHLIRGVVDEAEAIRAEQIEAMKNVMSIALAAVPLPGAGALLGRLVPATTAAAVNATVRTAVTSALDTAGGQLRDSLLTDRLTSGMALPSLTGRKAELRSNAQRVIQSWQLGEGEPELLSVLDASIM